MTLRDVTDAAELAALYDAVLVPSFPPDELVPLGWLVEGVASGSVAATAAYDGDDPTAVAVTEVVCPGVLLLSYLAALPERRGAGVGSRLLSHVRASAHRRGARLVLAEVERPDRHAASAEHGDPEARLRFYGGHGAQVLDLPYVQPAIGPGAEPVPGMLLLALDADRAILRAGGTAVDGRVVGRAIDAMLAEAGETPWGSAIRAAAAVPGVRLRPIADWAAAPQSEGLG